MLTQYYTLREACTALKVSPNTLRSRMVSGEISGRKVGGQWRFTEADLEKPAQRQDTICAAPAAISIVPLHRAKTTRYRPDSKTFKERLRADGYI